MTDHYLPLSYLNAWEYCPRRFYWEYVVGEMADNEHIILGRHLHRNIDEPGESREGDVLVRRQQWVWCDRLQVKGIIDAVEEKEGILVPLEYKKGRANKHLNDHFQLCGAALCLEERTGKSIAFGEIFYHGNRRRDRVEFTSDLRRATEVAIASARETAVGSMPAPIDNSRKCRDCSLKGICLPKELKYLHAHPERV
ncbi:CRISPR-associated protein Cas4 [Spirulina sp. 06S082]|uniref:CRISPR-associated protein Cas4 n=1 Tax=Spirulina sp. 06S082 TaxID=3110248 RepID=UPI002B2032DA|nr:CRISPR-associated protein Cas4 [Spirulina sp. 06S082]MEA5472498.1 CRISPR-associated protein Cas4 [Spirulina sp. 06S082]